MYVDRFLSVGVSYLPKCTIFFIVSKNKNLSQILSESGLEGAKLAKFSLKGS